MSYEVMSDAEFSEMMEKAYKNKPMQCLYCGVPCTKEQRYLIPTHLEMAGMTAGYLCKDCLDGDLLEEEYETVKR